MATVASVVESVRMYVMWPVSYSAWATCIVCRAVKPYLRLASCCKRAGGKGRIGPRGVGLVFQVGHPAGGVAKPLPQLAHLTLVQQQQAGVFQSARGRVEIAAGRDAAAADRDQFRLERLAARSWRKRPQQVPKRGRHKGHPLPLALDDQPHRHALHPAGRKPRADLSPQQRRNVVAVQAVDDAADLLGPDQIVVDLREGFPVRLRIASSVISWNTSRRTGTFGRSTSQRCQLMASPSRSSSVAR